MVAHITMPSNLHFKAWDELIQMPVNARVVAFLCLGFPVGYEGPVPTPAIGNHYSAVNHTRVVDMYVAT